jgi:hypothetical protein
MDRELPARLGARGTAGGRVIGTPLDIAEGLQGLIVEALVLQAVIFAAGVVVGWILRGFRQSQGPQ